MNVTLWIGQGLLAAIFTLSGVLKSTQSRDRMIERVRRDHGAGRRRALPAARTPHRGREHGYLCGRGARVMGSVR
jgi:hypothetical protein